MFIDIKKLKNVEDFDVLYMKVMRESHKQYFLNNMDEAKRLALIGAKLIGEKKRFIDGKRRKAKAKVIANKLKDIETKKRKADDTIDEASNVSFKEPTDES